MCQSTTSYSSNIPNQTLISSRIFHSLNRSQYFFLLENYFFNVKPPELVLDPEFIKAVPTALVEQVRKTHVV
ncbi:hypothetical protein Y032_0179g727 [Ancylostoma ceylanicum]|uniref:Uncharacterized protein n=1 Tax=Ancylostoma ceylanicum TaxID=53326 RepID=A0A016STP1_9BILA|nr:hypothetical protein Y032_0179g727 [Ancylostoma ceylanicum]